MARNRDKPKKMNSSNNNVEKQILQFQHEIKLKVNLLNIFWHVSNSFPLDGSVLRAISRHNQQIKDQG